MHHHCPRRAPRALPYGSSSGFLHSDIDVKLWIENTPSVEAVRPPRCPFCGAPSRPPGRALGLHGHGLRPRLLLGPRAPGQKPGFMEVLLRRYLCQRCAHTVTVAPRAVLWRRLYAAGTIAIALALWASKRRPAHAVRREVSPWWSHVGYTAAAGWASLRRWAEAIRAGTLFEMVRASPPSWSPRQVAKRAVETLTALAPASLRDESLETRAAAGAVQAR